jgi:hypothetical protein
MSDQNNPSADPRGLKKYLRIDAALFIASMLGAFTLSGFAHLEKFYLTLDVPIERLNISAQQYLSYGASGFGSFLSALFFAVALVGIVSLLILLFEKRKLDAPQPAPPAKWVANVRERAAENRGMFIIVGSIFLLAFLLMTAWYLLVRVPSNSGRAAALELATTCEVRQLTYKNLDQFSGCKISESDDMLYLLKRVKVDAKGVEYQTLELPKTGLKSITGEVQSYKYKR